MDERLSSLRAELSAIELWDAIHVKRVAPNWIEEMAYRARQERRQEITREILDLFTGYKV